MSTFIHDDCCERCPNTKECYAKGECLREPPVAPSRSAAPEPTIDEAVKLIKKIEACEGIGAKLTLLRNFVGKQARAAPPSANCVYEIRPDNPPPSCHVCGAVMVATRFNCRSCGATTEPTGAAPPSEREAAIGSDLPAFRAELEKQWMSQDVILDFRNWLVVALWNARAAVPQAAADVEDEKFAADFVDVFGGFPKDQAIALLVRRLGELRAAAVPAPGTPKIVCLCGSTRFYEQFMRSNYELTMQGIIVLSVGFVMHSAKQAHGEDVGCTAEQKMELDKLHKRKIDLADEVLVLNVGGYIGESTRSEIEHAERIGKPVNYLEPVAGATAPPKEAE